MSVGRLDLNSEGLLLLTNDGEIKRKLELPATGWTRKYRVRLKGTPRDEDFTPLRKGIKVEGETFRPMEVTFDRQQGANAWITVSLREGRNREIRRAMEALGFSVNRLIRVSYGPFRLGELKPGEVEELRPRVVRDQLGLDTGEEPRPKLRPKARKSAPGAKAARGREATPGSKPVPKGRAGPVAKAPARGRPPPAGKGRRGR